MSHGEVQHSRRHPWLKAGDPTTTRQHDDSSPQYHGSQSNGEKINGDIRAVNAFESSAAEFAGRRQLPRRTDEDNLPELFPDRNVTPDSRTSEEDAAARGECSQNSEDWYGLVSEPAVRGESASTSDDAVPLNLSLGTGRTVSDITSQRGRHDSPLPQAPTSDKSCTAELPSCTATRETPTSCRQRLIVRDKMYDIVTIGYGLWLLNDEGCHF